MSTQCFAKFGACFVVASTTHHDGASELWWAGDAVQKWEKRQNVPDIGIFFPNIIEFHPGNSIISGEDRTKAPGSSTSEVSRCSFPSRLWTRPPPPPQNSAQFHADPDPATGIDETKPSIPRSATETNQTKPLSPDLEPGIDETNLSWFETPPGFDETDPSRDPWIAAHVRDFHAKFPQSAMMTPEIDLAPLAHAHQPA